MYQVQISFNPKKPPYLYAHATYNREGKGVEMNQAYDATMKLNQLSENTRKTTAGFISYLCTHKTWHRVSFGTVEIELDFESMNVKEI